ATAVDRTWDVRDDTADQCYGGRSFESPRASAAVASPASLILTYGGQPRRALYASSSGGVSENVGCVLDAERVGGTWRCAKGWPYLAVVDDPAEALAYDPRGQNPHDELWVRRFSGAVIREQIIEDYGIDIGDFVAMQFNLSPGGRPVSVVVRGTADAVDLKGERVAPQRLRSLKKARYAKPDPSTPSQTIASTPARLGRSVHGCSTATAMTAVMSIAKLTWKTAGIIGARPRMLRRAYTAPAA